MGIITVRAVLIRVLSAALIFLMLRSDADVLVLPISLVLGNAMALVACFVYDRRVLKVHLCSVGKTYSWKIFVSSVPFFISRIASTVYQSLNAVILGAVFPGQAVVGWFNASDKILSVFKSISSPVADSIYPYMVRNRDFSLTKKILVYSSTPILLACTVLFVFADQFCGFAFGSAYAGSGDVLRCLIPSMAVIFPTYILCFPMLVPMGLSNYANISTVVGMVLQIGQLLILFMMGNLNVYSLCIASSVSEVSVFLFRLITVIRFRDRIPS